MFKVGELMEVILYVQDMSAQVAFYRGVLGLAVRQPQGVQDFSQVYWTELETGACVLALHAGGQRRFRLSDVMTLLEMAAAPSPPSTPSARPLRSRKASGSRN